MINADEKAVQAWCQSSNDLMFDKYNNKAQQKSWPSWQEDEQMNNTVQKLMSLETSEVATREIEEDRHHDGQWTL